MEQAHLYFPGITGSLTQIISSMNYYVCLSPPKDRLFAALDVISHEGSTPFGTKYLMIYLFPPPQNRLFVTLYVTSHECSTPSGIKYVLVDTVGFLSNLPTFLIASFGATLEDAVAADVLLHVRDVSLLVL